jgi:hypothetical protein
VLHRSASLSGGTMTSAGFHLQLYGDSLLSVEGPIVHSGKEHGGLDEHNQLPTMLAHQKVPRTCERLRRIPSWACTRARACEFGGTRFAAGSS